MAVKKYLKQVSGVLTEEAPITSSAGAGDGGKIIATDEATGKLSSSFLPSGIGADTISVTASEALSDGDFVNLYSNTGAFCRKADGSAAGKPADGFVLASVSSSGTATVYPIGTLNNHRSGMTPGARQYLSDTTPGAITATVPTTAGHVVQEIGVASSATEIIFKPGPAITLA